MSLLDRARRKSPLLIIFIAVFIDMLGYGMIVPLLPFLVPEQPNRGLIVGLLSSLYALMQLLVAPLLGAVSDRLGRRPILLACLAISCLAYVLLGLASSLWMIIFAIMVAGAGGSSVPTAQAYIADSTAPDERARGLGLVGAAFGLGLILGPASGGLLSRYGLSVPAFVAAGLALANLIYGLLVLPESLPAARRSHQPLGLGRLIGQLGQALALPNLRPLLLTIFLLNMGFAGLQSNFPLYSSERFGWDPVQNGIFFAFVGVCAVFTQGFLLGKLQPRLGEPLLVLGGLGLMAAGLGAVAIVSQTWALYPLVGLMALGSGLAIPALTSLVSRRAGELHQGAVLGGMQSLLSLTLILGPALAGLLYERMGLGAPYLSGGMLAGAALLVAAFTLWPSLRNQGAGEIAQATLTKQ